MVSHGVSMFFTLKFGMRQHFLACSTCVSSSMALEGWPWSLHFEIRCSTPMMSRAGSENRVTPVNTLFQLDGVQKPQLFWTASNSFPKLFGTKKAWQWQHPEVTGTPPALGPLWWNWLAYSRKSSTQIGLSKWPVNKETDDNHRSLGYPIFGHTHLTMVFSCRDIWTIQRDLVSDQAPKKSQGKPWWCKARWQPDMALARHRGTPRRFMARLFLLGVVFRSQLPSNQLRWRGYMCCFLVQVNLDPNLSSKL